MTGLKVFWTVMLLALGGGAAYLQVLGPPDQLAVAAPSRSGASPLAPPSGRTSTPSAGNTSAASSLLTDEPSPVATGPAAASMLATTAPTLGATAASQSTDPTHITPADRPSDPPPPQAARLAPPTAPEPPPLPRLPEPPTVSADRPIPPPDPALLEPSPHGPIPRVGPEGRTSIRAYARPFERADTRPRVALVVGNFGLSASLSEEAIRRLPPATALAFSPYALRPEPLLARARARGMEVLSALPLEPAGYPLNDPGERGLLTGATPAELGDRLTWTLARIAGQVGAVGALGPMRGERFAAVPDLLNGLQEALRSRGLLYLDPRPGAPAPARSFGRSVDLVVDEPATRGEIERRLTELERVARERGTAGALGLAFDPSPVLVDRVIAWAAGLEERGLVLAPVTALIRRGEEVPR